MANGKTGRNDAFRRRSRSDRNLRDAIDDAIADAMRDDTGRAMSDSDRNLMDEMLGRKERMGMSMMGESGKTLSDLDRQLLNEMSGRAGTVLGGLSDADRQRFREMMPSKPRMRPDVGAIERGNRAARRTAQDLSRMEDGGVALSGGQKKLDKNKDGKISGEDFKILRKEKKSTKGTKVKKMQGGGQVCRGGGAAMRGTNFSGVR